jgi:hypothetical protein
MTFRIIYLNILLIPLCFLGQISAETPSIDFPTLKIYTYKITKNNNYSSYYNDVVEHVRPNEVFQDSDKITTIHETNHQLNSNLRQIVRKNYKTPINCFYILGDNYVVLKEPPITLNDIAIRVPKSLRGNGYQLYLIDQQRYWQNEPLYILDEWICYVNSTMAGIELRVEEGGRLAKCAEFNTYALVLLQCSYLKLNEEDKKQLVDFVHLYTNRVRSLLELAKTRDYNAKNAENILSTMLTSEDCQNLRQFIKLINKE